MPVRLLLIALLPLALGARRPATANLVLCPAEGDCADALMWLDQVPYLDDAPLQLVEAVMGADSGGWESGEPLEDRYRTAMQIARDAIAEHHWVTADGAIEDAERCLERWAGTVPNAELFELFYLRGVAGLGQKEGMRARQSFERAAVLSWNRSQTLPVTDPEARDYWYSAQKALLEGETGRLRIGGATSAELYLDGVQLGAPPMELVVFPGRHRLTARDRDHELAWKRDVIVHPGATTTIAARFDQSGDAAWVTERLRAAMDGEAAPAEVLDVLADWSLRHGVRTLRILWAVPIEGRVRGDEGYLLRELDFDPVLRRLQAP
ncbi:MAG: hypothetical protein ABIO70_02470 [Pseudomonadota bacterium]